MLNYTKSCFRGERLQILFIILFTALFAYNAIAQEMGSLKRGIEISFSKKIYNAVLDPLPGGTYSIGTGGDFPTIDSAFNKLSIDGIAGEITLELIDNLYTVPADTFGFHIDGPIPGVGPGSRVIIKPAANTNVTIEGNWRYVLSFWNTSYVTLDGVGLTGSTTLTVHSLNNPQYAVNRGVGFLYNSDHNVVQNVIMICDKYMADGSGIVLVPNSSFAPDSNLIQNNFFRSGDVAIGIYANYTSGLPRPDGNTIVGNIIGSEADSLLSLGIQLEKVQNTIVENNIIQNLTIPDFSFDFSNGINSYWGIGNIIRNNIIHHITGGGPYTGGIMLSGSVGELGNNESVYNNMVYDIQSSVYSARVLGIQMWYQSSPKVYYNSVYLSGNGNGANYWGSAALYVEAACSNIDMRNNIFVNARNESPYTASSINSYTASNIISDYNDLYYESNQYNCLVRIGSTNYFTLEDWQITGQDINSITEMPNFTSPYLEINTTIATYLESGGIPISGIETDYEGDTRDAGSPDIGADEFDGIRIPVELTSFTASVNGKEVMLNWSTATELNNHGFEIQRSAEGEEFFTVGFVKGHGTTTEKHNYSYADKNLNNGKYYYRLKQVDYDGSYEYSDIVEVEWRVFNSYLLEQNWPNPFNPTTTIGFGIQNKSNVKITILNAIGEEIAVLLNEEKEAGYHQVEFNAVDLPSGVYIYQLKAGSFTETRKMILVK